MKFLILLLVVSNCAYSQTCVIAKIYNNVVYVGADSKENLTSYNLITGQPKRDTSFFCKLRNIGRFHFAVSGKFGEINIAIASKICKRENSLQKVIKEYENSIKKRLEDTLNDIKINDRLSYSKAYKVWSDLAICQIMFFGFVNIPDVC